MTLCIVLGSERKAFTYLYLREDLALEDLPPELLALIGATRKVMELDLEERDELANADINEVKRRLAEEGYYLQLPPDEDPEGWLELPKGGL